MGSAHRLIGRTGSGREMLAARRAENGHATEEWSRRTLRKAALATKRAGTRFRLCRADIGSSTLRFFFLG